MSDEKEQNPKVSPYDSTITRAEYRQYLKNCKECNSIPKQRKTVRRYDIENIANLILIMDNSRDVDTEGGIHDLHP